MRTEPSPDPVPEPDASYTPPAVESAEHIDNPLIGNGSTPPPTPP